MRYIGREINKQKKKMFNKNYNNNNMLEKCRFDI